MPSLEHVPALDLARRAPALWRQWAVALLDLVFPPFCPVCRARLGDGRRDPLCGACWLTIERIGPPWCRRCGKHLFISRGREMAPALPQWWTSREGGHADPHLFISGGPEMAPALPQSADARSGAGSRVCGECRLSPPAFAYARAAASYEEVAREAVHAFKFRGRRALAGPLGDLLVEVLARGLPQGLPDLLVPVPLHPRRQRERGFNQASLLAHHVGRALGRPVRDDVLARVVATQSQASLDASARRANVRGAFRLRRPELVAGRHVLVVDDVLTTGATLSECVHRLEDGGAAPIGVLTVARVR